MMNVLRKTCFRLGAAYSTAGNKIFAKTLLAENLTNRHLIRVHGKDVSPFLQGLITNDMTHLYRGSQAMYTMFLNKAGRVLYDSIIYRTTQDDTYLIECDKNVTNELKRHLRLFRVRRKIDIDSINQDYKVWSVFINENEETQNSVDIKLPTEGSIAIKDVDSLSHSDKMNLTNNTDSIEEIIICHDPRMKALGARLILPNSFNLSDISPLFDECKISESDDTNDYRYLRYKLGVGEGIVDLPPTKCFPLECNCDYLHGVSFHKGCYLGQEFTARTYHTGIVRKRLMSIEISENLEDTANNIQAPNGNVIGKIRGVKNKYALALIRIEQALESLSLHVDGVKCNVVQPTWWPKELPNKMNMKEKQM